MAKTAAEPAGTSGSQFFVVTGDDVGLPPDYAIVGTVTRASTSSSGSATLGDPATEQPLAARRDRLGDAVVGAVSRIAAVVLAAGAATRFGAPKQRLLLPRVLERLAASPVDEVVVVEGAYDARSTSHERASASCAARTGSAAPAPRSAAGSRSSATTSRRRSSSSRTGPTSPRRRSSA